MGNANFGNANLCYANARTEMRGQVLEKSLNGVIEKIAALLEGGAVPLARRATLQIALGNAIQILRVTPSRCSHRTRFEHSAHLEG